jgi:pyruvate dehydrogenase E1 component
LQHQDGHSHVLLSSVPTIATYHPAFAYEIAVIVREGICRMYEKQDSVFYYISVGNENYPMPKMPSGCKEGILKGMYKFKPAVLKKPAAKAQLFGSGAILNQVLEAQILLETNYNVAADVWSVTSYTQLRNDALAAERWNRLHPGEPPRVPHLSRILENASGPVIACTDYMKSLPDMIARWVPKPFRVVGTDGFGRSDTREALRRHFEIDAEHIVVATLSALCEEGRVPPGTVAKAIQTLGIDPERPEPREA